MTRVIVHDAGSTIILDCGAVIEGRPQGNAQQAETARELGYGDDVLKMVQDHDPLHVWLARQFGRESEALRQAAGLKSRASVALAEETAVLAVQKYMRMIGGKVPA